MSVILELVNRCNLQCVMCHQAWRNDSDKHTIDDKILDKLFQDFKENQLSCLMLSISEPLLYKNLPKILKKIEEAEIMDVFLFTNGTLLNKEKNKMILESNITRLFISIDALTSETYNKIRVPVSKRLKNSNRIVELENNIKNFMKMKKDMKKVLPLTRTSFVALNNNSHEVKKFISKWEQIVDSVEVQRLTAIEGWDQLKESKNKNIIKKLKKYDCNEPMGQISVYSDGTVAPCCNTFGRNEPIGNVKNFTIKEIWLGKKMQEIRNGFKENNPGKVCQICIENSDSKEYNKAII